MKIRNGFISNSSSCSFIVSTKEFPTTIDLAEFMVENRYEYKKEDYKDNIEYIKSHPDVRNDTIEETEKWMKENEEIYGVLKKNLNLVKIAKEDDNPNLAFKSVNFDTFIKQIEVEGIKYFYVSTCNNVTWEIPRIIPQGKSKIVYEPFSDGALYDGLWDEEYIQGDTFIRLDDNKAIDIKDRFKGLDQDE